MFGNPGILFSVYPTSLLFFFSLCVRVAQAVLGVALGCVPADRGGGK